MISDGRLFQPIVIYNKQIRVGFHSETLAYPIYSPIVFDEPAQATKYLGTFIKELVKAGDLPKDAVTEKNEVNEAIAKGAVQEIIIGTLETEDKE